MPESTDPCATAATVDPDEGRLHRRRARKPWDDGLMLDQVERHEWGVIANTLESTLDFREVVSWVLDA